MAQYIDKDALIAEIERLDTLYHTSKSLSGDLFIQGLFCFVDTFEVKEVDLEEKINEWLLCGNITDTRYDDYHDNDIIETAKHFFELGLKAQNND